MSLNSIITNLPQIHSYIQENSIKFLIPLLIIIYTLYYLKYRRYQFIQKKIEGQPDRARGQCPPFFPNGWYRICRSSELKNGDVKYIDYAGRRIAVFKGTNGKIYALDAYCAHMGVNLAVGGKVKNERCIECPFHGWMYDGETGKSVLDDTFTTRKGEFYEYNNCVNDPKKDENGSYLKKCGEGEVSIKKYELRERNGIIFVWFHSKEELRNKPDYEPKEYYPDIDHRGESVQYVNCHIQEIPENGADIRHFDYVHPEPAPHMGTTFARFRWAMKTKVASAPDFDEYMKHERKNVNEFKTKKLKQYLTDDIKPFTNVLSLDCYLILFGKWEFFFFNATGIQTGPCNVMLFLISPMFEATFIQNVIPIDKFMQKVYHNIYTSNYIPYAISALMLRLEVNQVDNDISIWNKKVFGSRLTYNMKAQADIFLKNWRDWYAQFYEGCREYENKINNLDW